MDITSWIILNWFGTSSMNFFYCSSNFLSIYYMILLKNYKMNHKMTTSQILEGYFLKGSNVILGQVWLHQNTYVFFILHG
jgi:hypothetical protein